MVESHAEATFLVYENERYTFKDTFEHTSRAPSIFRGVHKGDRVAIVMRNYPHVRYSAAAAGRPYQWSLGGAPMYRIRSESIRIIVFYTILNCRTFIVLFCHWPCCLLGAVPVLVIAFVPAHIISHCITLTACKLIILDAERSVRLATHLANICAISDATGGLVVKKNLM
jgi:acyl-CoA synthetase (AMP-forming)/AMP-acid ligase II